MTNNELFIKKCKSNNIKFEYTDDKTVAILVEDITRVTVKSELRNNIYIIKKDISKIDNYSINDWFKKEYIMIKVPIIKEYNLDYNNDSLYFNIYNVDDVYFGDNIFSITIK